MITHISRYDGYFFLEYHYNIITEDSKMMSSFIFWNFTEKNRKNETDYHL